MHLDHRAISPGPSEGASEEPGPYVRRRWPANAYPNRIIVIIEPRAVKRGGEALSLVAHLARAAWIANLPRELHEPGGACEQRGRDGRKSLALRVDSVCAMAYASAAGAALTVP